MTEDGLKVDVTETAGQPGIAALLLWLAILAGVPMAVAWHDGPAVRAPAARAYAFRPLTPPPAVEPMELVALDRDQARAFNAAIPFSTLPNPAARPFRFAGLAPALARATDCLAAAMLYEAGDDPVGERAVGQVVLNRLRHPAFPKTVCGVVFQGSERTTGCQFTFTCDGALARMPSPGGWDRARALAKKALSGAVYGKVGYSTHYHTDWVVPYWSGTLDKVAAVETHLFFRWIGWWGTPPAFRRSVSGDEPVIALLSRISPAHAADGETVTGMPASAAAGALAAAPLRSFGPEQIGKPFGGARLVAVDQASAGFIVLVDRKMPPDDFPKLADTFCGGRVQCRILAWMEPAKAADKFPVDPALLPSMAFSYIHDAGTGLQRALWNCGDFPRAAPIECMRDREPVPAATPVIVPLAPAKAPPKKVEHVVIRPPETSPAPAP
ncbi:MAG: cell wall hydrolase [Sphingobium phenoxybenzoativorans]